MGNLLHNDLLNNDLDAFCQQRRDKSFEVFFQRFLNKKISGSLSYKIKRFNVTTELVRKKLKIIPKDTADKARKFIHSIFAKNLIRPENINKDDLIKQVLIYIAN